MTINTNDVLSAITQASEALAREPKHLEQINFLQRDLGQVQSHNQNLELRIVDYKSNIESLEAKVRSLEVERDQAQFRTLELEDAAYRATTLLKNVGMAFADAIAVIDPPKPEPVVEQPSPVTPGQSDYTPTVHSSTSDGGQTTGEKVPASPPSTSYPESSSFGQPAPTADPVGFAGLSEADVKPPGKFANRKWSEANHEMNNKWDKSEWDANGGTYDGWNS